MKKPLLCRLGWHRWEVFGWTPGVMEAAVCLRCHWMRTRFYKDGGVRWFEPQEISEETDGGREAP